MLIYKKECLSWKKNELTMIVLAVLALRKFLKNLFRSI